jgi:NADPH:quinone reductase-like Zn-dependent oxidoreductase
MKALVYKRFGPPEVLEWVGDRPQPETGRGQTLVRVAAGSVNPKDVLLRKGRFRLLAREPLPRGTGLDAAGEVVAVGEGVEGLRPGDRAFGMSNRFCGGVLAEFALFEQDEVALAPAGLTGTEAAAVPLAALTALQALRDLCHLEPGMTVLVNGASGGVGHFAVQIARILGARVHAVCGPRNSGFVESLGADAVHRYSDRPANAIAQRFDAVFDVFGNYDRPAFRQQLGSKGAFVSTVPCRATLLAEMRARLGLSRRSRLVLVRSNAGDLAQLAGWIADGKLAPRVERVYPMEAAAEAHRHVESRHTVGKVVIELPGRL